MLTNLFRNTYFIAKQNLYDNLNQLIDSYGAPLGQHYKTRDAIKEIILSLGSTIEQFSLEKIKPKKNISLLIGESEDINKNKQLQIHVRYSEEGNNNEQYLTSIGLREFNARFICETIENYLIEAQISLNKDFNRS